MKTWKPDTCVKDDGSEGAPCWVEEIYNGTEIVGGGQVLNKCQFHKDVPDEDLWVALHSENTRKNKIYRALVGHEAIDLGLGEEKKNPDETSAGLGLKAGVVYDWKFEGVGLDRVLKFEVKGAVLSEKQKGDIAALAVDKFGEGKVEVI